MKNTTQNLTDAEALLLILKMSEKSIKNGKAIPIKKHSKIWIKKLRSLS